MAMPSKTLATPVLHIFVTMPEIRRSARQHIEPMGTDHASRGTLGEHIGKASHGYENQWCEQCSHRLASMPQGSVVHPEPICTNFHVRILVQQGTSKEINQRAKLSLDPKVRAFFITAKWSLLHFDTW